MNQRLQRIPNLTHPDAPVGLTEDDSRELRKVGTPRAFDFKPKDHVELGKALDLIDFETGGKVSGTGFYFLKNDAVLLDLALQQFALRKLIDAGFTPIITPDLARNSILEGIGFTPRGVETQVYSIEDTDLSLIGTAEITLGGMHADEILDESALPVEVRRAVALLPDRGRRRRPGQPRPVPRPPVHQGRDVRLQHARSLGRDPRRDAGDRGRPVSGAGHSLSRARYLLGRPGRSGLSQVRSRGLDARPRRARRVRRGDQHLGLHRLSSRGG